MQDLDFYVSKNGRYMMIENSILDRSNNQYADINELSFSDLINIIGENVGFMTQNLKYDLSEISYFTRKTAYNVFEYFETDTKLSLMMEYEVKFGTSLLNESLLNPNQVIKETWDWIKEKTQILEQTYNPFNKDFYTSSNWKKAGQNIVTGATSTAKSIGNAILHPLDTLNKGIEWVKKNGIGGVMEKVRDGLYSGVGVAVQIFLQFTGVGNVAVGIIWAIMLLWDLYKGFFKGEWSIMNIIFDILGIISGGFLKTARAGLESVGFLTAVEGKGVKQIIEAGFENPKTVGLFKQMGNFIVKGVKTILGWIKSGATFLYEKLGIKWGMEILGKAETWLAENILKPFGNGIGLKSVGSKALKGATGEVKTVGQAARQGIAGGARYETETNAIFNPAIKGGVKAYNYLKGGAPQLATAQDDLATSIASKYKGNF